GHWVLPIPLELHRKTGKFLPGIFFAGLALQESCRRAYSPRLRVDRRRRYCPRASEASERERAKIASKCARFMVVGQTIAAPTAILDSYRKSMLVREHYELLGKYDSSKSIDFDADELTQGIWHFESEFNDFRRDPSVGVSEFHHPSHSRAEQNLDGTGRRISEFGQSGRKDRGNALRGSKHRKSKVTLYAGYHRRNNRSQSRQPTELWPR